jgi:ABC-type lipoprotein release transport system permease subunit
MSSMASNISSSLVAIKARRQQKEVMHAMGLSANIVLALHVQWSLWVGTTNKVCVLE